MVEFIVTALENNHFERLDSEGTLKIINFLQNFIETQDRKNLQEQTPE